MNRTARGFAALLAGTLMFLLLHLCFVTTWARLFLTAPWPRYEESARLGLIEPWFMNSPRSLWLTRIAFLLLAFAFAVARGRGRWPFAFLIWAGAAIGVATTYATTSMPAMPHGALGYVLYPFRLALPILLGTGLGALLRRTPDRVRAAHGAGGAAAP
ncbi:MAG: hypothetical protein PVH00_12615 [Gemmatimonadota bacterium]